MKIHIYILPLLLLFAACSNFTDTPDNKQFQVIPVPDSLKTFIYNTPLDSLLRIASIAPQDTNLAKLYFEIIDIYENEDFEKAKEYYLKLESLIEQLDWNTGRYLYVFSLSNLLIREGLGDSAITLLQNVYDMAMHENNESYMANSIVNIGNAYFGKEWYETALPYYMEAIPIYERMNATENLQILYYMMAQLYLCINDMDRAIEYGKKSVALDLENPFALCALAMAYSTAHQYDKATSYFENALNISKQQNNIYLMGVIYWHLANNDLFVFDLDKAERYALQSLKFNQQFGHETCCDDFILLSKLEQLKGNYYKSEEYAKEALQIAETLDALEGKKTCFKILSELALVRGKYSENIRYWREIDAVEMAIAYKTTLRSSEEMFAKYETAKKEIEIERQQRVITRQNTQRILLMVGVSICILILALLWHIIRLRDRRNQALAEMNATKDKFFNIISHDLKNPAIAQRDALKMFFEKATQWDALTLQNYIYEMLHSADTQVELLHNLLKWAQLQSSRMICHLAPFDFAHEIRSDLALVRKIADNKGVLFEIEIPQQTIIIADVCMITTVVRNLLSNAVKFTASGGAVMLKVTSSQNRKCTILVCDTGIGMSEEVQQGIFHIDCHNSRQGTSGETGTGLGLIICKEMLEKHGSTLHIESEEGKGSRFWFEIEKS